MLRACRGPDLRDRRDEAILRLMFTTGARAGEVAAMQVNDLNLRSVPPTVIIRHGKGGKGQGGSASSEDSRRDRQIPTRP